MSTPNTPTEPFFGLENQIWRTLIDNLPVNLVLTDRQGRVTFGNALYLKTIGRTLADVLGKTDFDLFPEALAKKYWLDTSQVMETGEVFEDVEHHRSPNGDNFYVQVLKTPMRDGQGAISGVQILFWDVTEREHAKELTRANAALREQIAERERAERELRDSQALYQSLVQHLPVNVLRKDREGRFSFGNALALKTLGKTLAELLGQTDGNLFPEELARKYRQDDLRVMETGAVFEDVERHRAPQGDDLFVEVLKTPVRDSQAAIVGVQILFWDVTERELVKRELAKERELLRAFMDYFPDPIYFKDRQSRFLRISNAMADRFHLASPEEAVGKSDFDFYSPEHAQPAFEHDQRILQTAEPLIGLLEKETWIDGRVTWVLTTKMPLRDKDGAIIGTFGTSKDITALKQAEEEIERTHQQLLEASRRAGMAEVATGILHNVGNVLNSVNVSATLIAEKLKNSRITMVRKLALMLNDHADELGRFLTEDDKGRQVPDYLNKLSEHLAEEQQVLLTEFESVRQNIDHIKDIVAMQQNYAPVSEVVESAPVRELIEDALKLLSGAYLRHDVQITREYAAEPSITTTKHKVLQILVNLLQNARYACDESAQADKQVKVRIAGSGEDRVRIEVADNGIGISTENLIRIFQHGFTTRKTGHGFGLHSCALAAKQLGGTLTAHSEGPGKGATFVLELPLRAEEKSHDGFRQTIKWLKTSI